ncbi:MAG: UvrD-helicase domain-containing protein [Armatimonadota bacterium]|nr:UvrD-helicase domain-containing protein [Armatimonadota bacterium]
MNTLIRASAGSGKTYALTTEYLRLLRARHQALTDGDEAGLRPESLLAATFTRKAAGEIADRILSRLATAALDETALAQLQADLEDPTLTPDACQDLLLRVCQSLHRLSVGTLDGFFQRLCAVYRHETSLGGAAVRMTDPNSPRCVVLRRDAVRALLGRLEPAELEGLLDDLNEHKVPAPVLTAFEALLKNLLEKAENVSDAAWERLEIPDLPAPERIDAALSALETAMPDLANGHWRNAVRDDLKRFRGGEWEAFCTTGIAKCCLALEPTYRNGPVSDELQALYAVLLTVAKRELLLPVRRRTLAVRHLLNAFVREYAHLRRAEGLMLFSEAPVLLAALLGDPGETARRLDAPIEHLLLDEFQDTSDAQWGIMRGFALAAAQSPRSVFVVGDMKQAIYGWRGGRAEIFERASGELPEMQPTPRDVSFRSSQTILDTVNTVFGSLTENPILSDYSGARERWANHFHRHAAKRDLPGFVEVCATPETDGDSWDACAERIAAWTRRMPSTATAGVLVRRNATADALGDALRLRGVDVSSEGSSTVADDPAVEVILAALTFADHPGHTAAAFHVARSPLAESLGLPADLHAQPAQAAKVANTLRRRILAQGYAGVVADWAAILAPCGTARTTRRLEQLLAKAAEFDSLPPMRASEFVRAVREASLETPGAARVRVMTINRAKGLEFDAVFLPEMDWTVGLHHPPCLIQRADVAAIAAGAPLIEAVYSHARESIRNLDPGMTGAHQAFMDEEVTGLLCLLYVAMTRARHALHLYTTPTARKLTPAALVCHALTGEKAPPPGPEWVTLHTAGDADAWYAAEATDDPIAPPAPAERPAFRFAPSNDTRRRPASAWGGDDGLTVVDLLQLD